MMFSVLLLEVCSTNGWRDLWKIEILPMSVLHLPTWIGETVMSRYSLLAITQSLEWLTLRNVLLYLKSFVMIAWYSCLSIQWLHLHAPMMCLHPCMAPLPWSVALLSGISVSVITGDQDCIIASWWGLRKSCTWTTLFSPLYIKNGLQ